MTTIVPETELGADPAAKSQSCAVELDAEPGCVELAATEAVVVDDTTTAMPDDNLMGDLVPQHVACATALDTSLILLANAAVAPPAEPTLVLVNADQLLSKVWNEFGDYKVEQREWKIEEKIAARSVLRLLVDVVGDLPLGAYTGRDMRRVRTTFLALPAKYAQQQPWRDIYNEKGPSAVVEASRTATLQRTTTKSWNKVYGRAFGVFEYAKTGLALALAPTAPNPCEGLFIAPSRNSKKLTRAQKDERRRVFSSDELEQLFNAPKMVGAASASRWKDAGALVVRDHRYWLLPIGFLHGTRREEPVVLKVKHVKKCPVTSIWYFDFEDPEVCEQLKATGSPRLVPLHHVLLDLGFLEARVFGRDSEERLFPEAETTAEIGGDAGPFGQWFLRFRRSLGVNDPRADFHAARTTAMNLLEEAGVARAIIEALCGWESTERRSTLDEYKRPKKLQVLKDAVDKIEMPIDVSAYAVAVTRSDSIDRRAAWPEFDAPRKWAAKG